MGYDYEGVSRDIGIYIMLVSIIIIECQQRYNISRV